MFEVSVTDTFDAAHQLQYAGGQPEPLHRHNWRVTVTYAGDVLDETGVLLDFVALRARLKAVVAPLNGWSLHELPQFASGNPSGELVACFVGAQLAAELPGAARLACVAVEEEPGCIARYVPPHDGARVPCG